MNQSNNNFKHTNSNKKILIIGISIILIILLIIIIYLLFKKNIISSNDTESLFQKNNMIVDTYITEDYYNNVLYTNVIYVPKNLTRKIQTNTLAFYTYKDDDKSISLLYKSCLNEESIKSFISNDPYTKEENYYIYKTENSIKIYFKNEFNIYQTIELSLYSFNQENQLKLDDSYKYLLENLSTSIADTNDFYISNENGFYNNYISYMDYINENDKSYFKIEYSVDSTKYGTDYDKNIISPSLYLDNSHMSFYEGQITNDISSIKAQTRIHLYVTKIFDLDVKEEAIDSLEWPLNQSAFDNVSENDVNIETSSFNYNNQEVLYYKIESNNNSSYGERINSYLKLKDNYYYVISIYGGENKNLDLTMINDFLPKNIEEK